METSSDVRNHMIIPALLSTFLVPGCDALSSAGPSAALRAASVPTADRRELMRERMGSSTGEEEEGTTAIGGGSTTGGEMGATAAETTAGDGGAETDDFPIADTEGCPWWGCDGLPGQSWQELITDCTYPIGRPDIGDAKCPSPRRCLIPEDFEPNPLGDNVIMEDAWQVAICTISCPGYVYGVVDSCELIAREMPGGNLDGSSPYCVSPSPDPTSTHYCVYWGRDGQSLPPDSGPWWSRWVKGYWDGNPWHEGSVWYDGYSKVCPDGFDPVEDCGLPPAP